MRNGYQEIFLGDAHKIAPPVPGLALQADVLQPPGLPDGEIIVPYINYSLVMSRSTKQALYSVANIDLDKMQTVSGKKGRNWFVDPRVGKENQIPNYPYKNSPWDRGHLTRRTAVTWGANVNEATKASNDSCAYTNACMQHENFNEDDWRAIETLVSEFEEARKLSVMTGPVFTQADRFFIRELRDEPVRIPAAFWKTLSYVGQDGTLKTQAYIFFQDLPSIKNKKGRARLRVKDMQVTTTELSLWTGLEFDQAMFDSNPLKFYSGPQSISVKKRKEILTKAPETLALDAGIAEGNAIDAARSELPINDFYDLIAEISWV